MPAWVIWILIAAALTVGEVATLGFLLGAIVPAALLAAAVAAFGGGVALQLVALIAGSLASLAFLRPIARRQLRTPAALRTGTAALTGASAVVLERVDADGGRVKINGEVWSARAFIEDQTFDPGARVQVLEIKGATALVHD